MQNNTSTSRRIINFIASPYFFGLVVLVLVVQALWLALSGIYPMAFDEDFHLGIIKLYAEYTSPFWGAHPPGADAYGAISRDPSYLYHYLMSFPYRIIVAATDSTAVQIISLRLINIAFFTSGLFLWRAALLKTKASPAIVHLSLLMFILLPIVPFLAAQINYDNVFIPLVAAVFLFASRVATSITNKKTIRAEDLSILIIVCLATSLIKYAFLPIFIAVVLYLSVVIYLHRSHRAKITKGLVKSWKSLSIVLKASLIVSLLIISGLFAERYLVNMVRYHEPVPDCSKVLSVDQCRQYGPWGRDYDIASRKPADAPANPVAFSYDWVTGMWLRTFFAVSGPSNEFETKGPFLVPATGAIVIIIFALISTVIYWRNIWRQYQKPVIALFLTVIFIYIGLLWIDRYQSYIKLGQTVALNGRYLLPIILPVMLLGALGVNELFKRHDSFKLGVATTFVIIFMLGGGGLTFVLRSNDAWLWNNSIVIKSNQQLRNTIGPVIPGYNNPGLFMSQN